MGNSSRPKVIMAHLDWGLDWRGVLEESTGYVRTVDGKYREHESKPRSALCLSFGDFKDHTIGGMACSE